MATEVNETNEANEGEGGVFFFIGKPFEYDGELHTLSAYFMPAHDQVSDVLASMKDIFSMYGLKAVGATASASNTAVADDGSVVETKPANCFIRRNQRNKNPKEGQSATTPIIDVYPPYVRGANGVYGVFPLVSVWLNNDEQVAAFEKATGLRLADLPLYASQTPAKRDPDYVADWEVHLENPINIQIKTSPKMKEDGTPGKMVRLHSWTA